MGKDGFMIHVVFATDSRNTNEFSWTILQLVVYEIITLFEKDTWTQIP